MPTLEVQFAAGARTTCVIEAGALGRLPALCAQAGLSGTAGLVCDAKLVSLQRDALLALRPAFGDPLARLSALAATRDPVYARLADATLYVHEGLSPQAVAAQAALAIADLEARRAHA